MKQKSRWWVYSAVVKLDMVIFVLCLILYNAVGKQHGWSDTEKGLAIAGVILILAAHGAVVGWARDHQKEGE